MFARVQTTRFMRGRLPHWEIEGGRYFVTVRLHDSLPREVVTRLAEVHQSLQNIEARSSEYVRLQRQYFLTMEKYLDAGVGSAPLRHDVAAKVLAEAFAGLRQENVDVPHFTIMPNHWHALLEPVGEHQVNLHDVMTRFKGRTARAINRALDRHGVLWQREWFDRWMRTEAEWNRCRDYIRQNPVKAGLVRDWREDPWTR